MSRLASAAREAPATPARLRAVASRNAWGFEGRAAQRCSTRAGRMLPPSLRWKRNGPLSRLYRRPIDGSSDRKRWWVYQSVGVPLAGRRAARCGPRRSGRRDSGRALWAARRWRPQRGPGSVSALLPCVPHRNRWRPGPL